MTTAESQAVGVVAIVRLREQQAPPALLETLAGAGISRVEITLPSPGALATITQWRDHGAALIGAGTVRTAEQAAAAIDAGASFLVTPTTEEAVLDLAAQRQIPVYCGAMTPTEIDRAHSHPATAAVKVFPAGALGGESYIAAVREPLADVPLLPTGGVGPAQARRYAELGCVGVGVGGSLINDRVVAQQDWDAMREAAQDLVIAWHDGSTGSPA